MAGRGEHIASERRIVAKDKQRQAIELKLAGASYRAIADRLGYGGPSGAYKAVITGLKEAVREPAEELVTVELERLDRIFLGHWPAAIRGNKAATDACIKVMERRAKLLGLDAPTKVENTGANGEPIRFIVDHSPLEAAS